MMPTYCSSCGDIIPEGTGSSIRREWKRKGWKFCDKCVTSCKAREWAEKKEQQSRNET